MKHHYLKLFIAILPGQVLLWILILPNYATSQQWHQSSLAAFNKYRDFGAYGGLERVTGVFVQYRAQWDRLLENPRMFYLGVNTPMYELGGAVGIDIQNNKEGQFNLTRLRGSYNYVLSTPVGFLSLGGRLSLNSLGLDGNNLRTPDGDYADGILNHNDPLLTNSQSSGFGIGWDLSAYFIGKKIQFGLSVAEIPSGRIKSKNFDIEMRRNISSIIQYRTGLADGLVWQTGLLARTDMVVLQTEVYNHFLYRNDYTIGLNLRGYNTNSLDALSIIFGYRLNDVYSFYYSYDFGLSSLRKVNDGSHDVVLRIKFRSLSGQGLKPPVIYNPRFL